MQLNDLLVLKNSSGKLLRCAEHCDPIAMFDNQLEAQEHAEYYGAGNGEFVPVKLADLIGIEGS